jgi:hypothetical protein
MNDRATEFKWPKLVEFVEQSEPRVVAATTPVPSGKDGL